ncbi:uncharacterized protein TNCV_3340081 [Trichonephila clavipes]|nr:uncharacterized protein TNCV_3340081 [Trichonephila clavipes]
MTKKLTIYFFVYLAFDDTAFNKGLLVEMASLNSVQLELILKKMHNSLFTVFTARRFLSSVHTFPMTLKIRGCGSPVVRVSDHGRYVMSSSPVPLKTRRVGQRRTLNLSRAETSSRWCGVVVRRGGASSSVVRVT